MWRDALSEERGRRIRGQIDGVPARVLTLARGRVDKAMSALRVIPDDSKGDVGARKQRAMQAATSLVDDINSLQEIKTSEVAWVEGSEEFPVLRIAPIDVGELLDETLWT